MFKISEFSQLSQVSIKTLRYYDQLGLLKPAQTDPYTGYRYYTASQLLRLNRIMAFKELGFTLEQIVQLLDEQISPEQMQGMFRLKKAQVQELIRSEQERLARLEGRLRQIEREGGELPQHDVVLKAVEPQLVASIRKKTSILYIPLLCKELERYLKAQGTSAVATLPHMLLWHGCEVCEDAIDVEVAVPIARRLEDSERVRVRTLPGMPMAASMLHSCQPQSVCTGSSDLADWIEKNRYCMVANEPRREVYLTLGDDGFYMAEVQIAVMQEGTGSV